jgi:hypothetical protein
MRVDVGAHRYAVFLPALLPMVVSVISVSRQHMALGKARAAVEDTDGTAAGPACGKLKAE